MGALISSIKDNKIEKISFSGTNEELDESKNSDMSDVYEKYKKMLNDNGFYKISIDLEKFGEYIDKSLNKIERFDSVKMRKTFKNKRIIEKFIGKDYKNSLKNITGIPSLFPLMIGSILGFYTISYKQSDNKNPKKISDVYIIVSKMFFDKEKYNEIINFLFDEYLIKVNNEQSNKNIDEETYSNVENENIKNLSKLKESAKVIFNKITSKKNPDVFFANVIGFFVKCSILIVAYHYYEDKIDMSTKLMNLLIEDVGDFIPDDVCKFNLNESGFINFEPSLCINSGSYDRELKSYIVQSAVLLFLLFIFIILYITK